MMGHTLLPYDFDTTKPLFVRVHWSSGSATAADTITWLFEYTAITPNVTAIVAPATALTTTIAEDTVGVATANIWCTTEWGQIAGNTISQKAEAMTFEVEMDAFAAGLTEAKHLLGVEFRYTPKRLQGPDGMSLPAKSTLAMLGKAY
jgi:hypothetical protein